MLVLVAEKVLIAEDLLVSYSVFSALVPGFASVEVDPLDRQRRRRLSRGIRLFSIRVLRRW